MGLLLGPFGLLVFAMPKVEPAADLPENKEEPAAVKALVADGGWMCPHCGYTNGPTRSACGGCDKPRPGLAAGETTCPMCKETIKVGALKCKHCGELFVQPAR